MSKSTLLLIAMLMQSCSGYLLGKDKSDMGYFSDASDCYRSSERNVSVKVPAAGTMTVIDVPIGNDANMFSLCMEHAGHPPTHANPEDYLILSRACSQHARDSSKADKTYATCIQNGKITVETLAPGNSNYPKPKD